MTYDIGLPIKNVKRETEKICLICRGSYVLFIFVEFVTLFSVVLYCAQIKLFYLHGAFVYFYNLYRNG
jgi:hypothetical protein